MNAEEFYAAYCERSGIDPLKLASYGRRAYRCECGEEGCEGWAMVGIEWVKEEREEGFQTSVTRGINLDDEGYAPSAAVPESSEQ